MQLMQHAMLMRRFGEAYLGLSRVPLWGLITTVEKSAQRAQMRQSQHTAGKDRPRKCMAWLRPSEGPDRWFVPPGPVCKSADIGKQPFLEENKKRTKSGMGGKSHP